MKKVYLQEWKSKSRERSSNKVIESIDKFVMGYLSFRELHFSRTVRQGAKDNLLVFEKKGMDGWRKEICHDCDRTQQI